MNRLFPIGLMLFAAVSVDARCTARMITAPVKIRPYSLLPAESDRLACARGEACSFQVVVTAEEGMCGVTDARLTLQRLASGSDAAPFKSVIYRQAFIHVFYSSLRPDALGEWPDPLIPAVDPLHGEQRSAFPFEVSPVSRAYRRYSRQNGNAVIANGGTAEVLPGGTYSGRLNRRYVFRVIEPGAVGRARLEWWSQPGPVRKRVLTTSHQPVPLEYGLTIAFTEDEAQSSAATAPPHFVAGDEFWFYAGPARHQPLWVDLYVPADAAPGHFRGEVNLFLAGGETLALPFEIEVLPFEVPSTSSLASYFQAYMPGACAAHYGSACSPTQLLSLARSYAWMGLLNRITVDTARGFEPRWDDAGRLRSSDLERYAAAVQPFLDGIDTPFGSRWTSLRVPQWPQADEELMARVLKEFVQFVEARGWKSRLFDYTFDEPHPARPEHRRAVQRRAELLRTAVPDVPRLVTTHLQPEYVGLVTRWCPLVNTFEPRYWSLGEWRRKRSLPRREDYDPRLAAGDSLWWYQSCESHGCGRGFEQQHVSWPSYMVDVSAAANRVLGLLSAAVYDISGVLYWDVNYALSRGADARGQVPDPWESIYYFGGNGDGTLFYPGRPGQIGGKTHIPIESLRLKFIRDSFVDAEYAYLLKSCGEEEFLRREVRRVVQSASRWSDEPEEWLRLRAALAERLRSHCMSRSPVSGKPATKN